MKLNTLLTIASIYMALVGLGLIFFPQQFGRGAVPANASLALICYLRLWGSPLLGIAVLDWMVRKEGPSVARDAIIAGNIIGFAAITALDGWGLLHDARPITKVFVLVHLCFTIVFILIGRKNLSRRLIS